MMKRTWRKRVGIPALDWALRLVDKIEPMLVDGAAEQFAKVCDCCRETELCRSESRGAE